MKRIASCLLLVLLVVEALTLVVIIRPVRTGPEAAVTQKQTWASRTDASKDKDEVTAQDTDWWTMYRHEPQHIGYSTSKATRTNQTLWIHSFGDWVSTSPAVHDNRVFVGSDDTNVYALDAASGVKIWNYTTRRAISSSPAVVDGRVYVGSDNGKMYCLNETTGVFLWSYQTGQSISSSPCVADGKVLFGSDDYKLYCLDATAGGLIWNYPTGAGITSSPATANGTVFFGSSDFKVYSLNLTNGRLIWSYDTRGSVTVSPSVVNNKVFISSSKNMYCFQASNGGIAWNRTVAGLIHSSPAIAGGNIYFGCDDKNMYCLNASNGAPKWNFTVQGYIYSSPAVAEQKVYFGSNDENVYCLDATDGTFIWSYNTGGSVRTSSPAVADKVVFVASSYSPVWTGKLFAFGPANSPPKASNLAITPPSPATTDNLVGHYDYYDADRDPDSGSQIRWYEAGVLQSKYDDALTIPANETSKGQTWFFTVRPCDGTDFGQLQTSAEVTIRNSPPVIEQYTPLNDPTIREGETQVFNITKSDADLDPLTVAWFLNSSETFETSDSFSYVAGYESAGTYNVTAAVSDGVSQARHEWLMTVLNVERDVAVTSFILSKTIVGRGFMVKINVTVENQGDMAETLNVTVWANATEIDTKEVTLQSRTSALITFIWNTSDFAEGHYVLSAFASYVPWEHDITDNILEDGWVVISIPGDVNGDFVVNVFDAVTATSVYMAKKGDPRYMPNRDINDDGVVNLLDIVILTSHYGQRYP